MKRLPIAFVSGSLALFLVTMGCAGPVSLHETRPAAEIQWPRQTAGPKIVWIKTIAGYRDAGITKGFWARALEFITGEDERRIVRPYGILHDAGGRLFIADPGGGVVHWLDITGNRYSVIGAAAPPYLRTPIGLAEDDSDHLYITDSSAGTVFVLDIKDGTLKPFLVNKAVRPTGIAYNRVNKLLYIVDTIGNRVIAVDSAGNERIRFGGADEAPGGFNHPTDITVDNRGLLYLTDPLNYRIGIFAPEGSFLTQFGAAGDTIGYLDKPKGIAVDSAGHIYVCDSLLDTVQVFDADGRLLLSFGASGRGNGAFWMPSGIYIDSSDFIFVADTYNRRVQVFRYLPGTGAELGGDTGRQPELEKKP